MNINDKVMALIKCSECGHMISDKARKCPKCGCPLAHQAPPTQSSTPNNASWPTIEYVANFNEGLNSIGGKIIITATQLIFRAHDFNFGDLRDRVYEIRLLKKPNVDKKSILDKAKECGYKVKVEKTPSASATEKILWEKEGCISVAATIDREAGNVEYK